MPIPDHLHWQHRVFPGPKADWGAAVVGIADLEQSMRIICLTPKLSVPTEPEKFCNALDYIDRPPAIAIPRISQEIWDALAKWEPRIVVERVEVEAVGFHHFRTPVFWRPREDVIGELLQTDIELREAA
ncbi:baseplate [Roseibium sp. TrichSKD4]|uniref:phage baseplate assembly protein n=1 Tax=Roseibium sp. TrichSKD4 TaxID=744980 RepID=UPI0001E569CB|nr:phage baseplate assembly protein [Roseibium sp. TrichSKD4]EFO32510.1 baseplate [Roseibium sp. TrichSKD4]